MISSSISHITIGNTRHCTRCPFVCMVASSHSHTQTANACNAHVPGVRQRKEPMTKKIVLISCVSKKLSHRASAENIYTSSLFKLNLKYAKKLAPDAIYILSAKHGLLSLNQEVDPYELTLSNMKASEVKEWAEKVIEQIKNISTIDNTEYIFLAGEKYRKYLLPHLNKTRIPLQGLRIGEQLQRLKELSKMSTECEIVHKLTSKLERHHFPFDESKIPSNGMYILFQKGEEGHEGDRIVRIGTHTGENQLRPRLKQHFLNQNKDRSIFRKNIGRALLSQSNDPFLEYWELDLTTRKAKDRYSSSIDFDYQNSVELQVTDLIQNEFSFCVFEIGDKDQRLRFEALLISTVSLCSICKPSPAWLGNSSPKEKISESGLWLVNELYKTPFNSETIGSLSKLIEC